MGSEMCIRDRPVPQGPPPPKPGTEEWVYVQEPIDPVRLVDIDEIS